MAERANIRRKRHAMRARPMDQRTAGEAFSYPGIDPRQWISIGRVDAQTEDDPDPIVTFDEQLGPLVKVTLLPSGVPALCRVGMEFAGDGEGEYSPFVEGDEVLVAIPEGNERSGCVIIKRLSNERTPFPLDSVAGQDPTTNTFAFRRRRTPTIEENAGPIFFREAATGAFLSIDSAGVVTLKDGENASLQMSPDAFTYQGPSDESTPPRFLLQLDFDGEHFLVQVDDAIISIGSSGSNPEQNTISVPGPLTLGTSGNAPIEHATTTEAVVNLLFQELTSLAEAITALGAASLTGASLGGAITTWLTTGPFTAAITTAAGTPLLASNVAAIIAGILAQPQKLSVPGGQTNPGIGSAGLLIG